MITRKALKAEIDKVGERFLNTLYGIVKALETPAHKIAARDKEALEWHDFIEKTYGCFADAPIERGEEEKFEVRMEIQ